MPSLLSVRVENIDKSKLFVASALLNSTGGGLMMAFLLIYFDRTTDVGLAVILGLADEVSIEPSENGTVVRMSWPLPKGGAGDSDPPGLG